LTGNNSEFYRGKKKRTGPALIASIVVLSLVAFVILLFYGLQKYIVVTGDGLYLDIPLLSGTKITDTDEDGTVTRQFEQVDAELIVGEPDYTNIKATAGENLSAVKAVMVPADSINAQSVETYAASLGEGDTLLLDVKTVTGMLVWNSKVELAAGYGTAGSVDLAAIVSSLKDKDIRVAARICCFVDNTLASRYSQLALKTADGTAFSDENGAWLDPTNTIVKGYIVDICKELADMGVDEIVLNGMRMPETEGASFSYSASSTAEQTPQTVISAFAISVARSLRSAGVTLSVQVGSDSAMSSVDTVTGQSAGLFLKMFDRVYRTSSAENVSGELEAIAGQITLGEAKFRYVPMVSGDAPDTECWVLVD